LGLETAFLATFISSWTWKRRFLPLFSLVGAGNGVSCHFYFQLELETSFLITFISSWGWKRRFLPLLSPVGAGNGVSNHFYFQLEPSMRISCPFRARVMIKDEFSSCFWGLMGGSVAGFD